MPIHTPLPDPAFAAGPSCERSSLPPMVRFGIFFGVLFALKLALPWLGVSPVLQVLGVAAAATFMSWRFWWGCGTSHRGVLLLVGLFWAASIAKILAL